MRVVLIGNYPPDRQESMRRYAQMVLAGLSMVGHEVALVEPRPVLNRRGHGPYGVWKWAGYLDKYWLGKNGMRQAMRTADVVHVCDHSNAVYVPRMPRVPYVVTCHDLLAVRGALGEETDCPASALGSRLQQAIMTGLRRAQAIACVSRATFADARRLLGPRYRGRLVVTPNALNFPYRTLAASELASRLGELPALSAGHYVLHVGSNLRRKNREVVLHSFARIAAGWDGLLVFAGRPLSPHLTALAGALGVAGRVIEVPEPSNELLEALYNGARALIFPSRFEGFGWPIIEAQACGCPVLCSDRVPLPEVAGAGAIVCDAEDAGAFGDAVLRLETDPALRERLRQLGLANAARYSRAALIEQLVELYGALAGRA